MKALDELKSLPPYRRKIKTIGELERQLLAALKRSLEK
jgi:hypothetical protein